MPSDLRFSELSLQRQALVRLCQSINYGHIEDLTVVEREPVMGGAAPTGVVDVRLDADEQPRGELGMTDFTLCAEVCRLMLLLDRVETGGISKIEVRAGIPRRVLLRNGLQAREVE